jgi:hypothetical protein
MPEVGIIRIISVKATYVNLKQVKRVKFGKLFRESKNI